MHLADHGRQRRAAVRSGVAALRAGRRLIQAAQLLPPYPGHEYDVSCLKHEFFFERMVEARAEPQELKSP